MTHTPEAIFTWHAFQVVRQLSLRERPQEDVRCGKPRAVEIKPGEIVVPLVRGTADIEGITVSMAPPPEITLESNHEYLLLAIVCGNGVLELPHGEQDIVGVDANGRILPSRYDGHGFVHDPVALGTSMPSPTAFARWSGSSKRHEWRGISDNVGASTCLAP